MADLYSTVSITGYNSNPPADDGSAVEANRVKWSTIKTKLNDPVKTRSDDMDAALIAAFAKTFGAGGVVSTAIGYTVLSTDQGGLVKVTGSGVTITTPDATDVDAPFTFAILNNSAGNITIDGSGSQTIDGSATITIPTGAGAIFFTDGSNWFTAGKNFFQAGSGISFNTATSPISVSAQIPGFLSGLTMSTAGSSTTMSIAAGAANDAANTALMILSAAINKTTASWVVGTNQGGLDTGSIATSTWYHWYLIKRTDTGVVDVIFSTSASAPTLPTGYTLYRRIGSMKTNGSGQWTTFTQDGDLFIWNVSVADVASDSVSTSLVNPTLTVPTGVQVNALFRGSVSSGGSNTGILFTSSAAESNQAPNAAVFSDLVGIVGGGQSGSFERLTDTLARIGVRGSVASGTYSIYTYGWKDRRGK